MKQTLTRSIIKNLKENFNMDPDTLTTTGTGKEIYDYFKEVYGDNEQGKEFFKDLEEHEYNDIQITFIEPYYDGSIKLLEPSNYRLKVKDGSKYKNEYEVHYFWLDHGNLDNQRVETILADNMDEAHSIASRVVHNSNSYNDYQLYYSDNDAKDRG